jgi:hypothetical protein
MWGVGGRWGSASQRRAASHACAIAVYAAFTPLRPQYVDEIESQKSNYA